MTGEGDLQTPAATNVPPLVDGEMMLQAGALGLTYLVPVVALRALLRLFHGLRGRLQVGRPALATAVIESKGSG